MNVFIKTFNRPYYLERCLKSIYHHLKGFDKVIILDDGTDNKYLDIIEKKYPKVIIERSELAEEKIKKIEQHIHNGINVSGLRLPTKFWKDSINKHAGVYFLLLEDDIWLTENVNLEEVAYLLSDNDIPSLKLNTFSNPHLMSGQSSYIKNGINKIEPWLITKSPILFKNLILRNPLKILSFASRLGLYDPLRKIDYYTIYTVAGAIISNEYYNFLWDGFDNIMTEDGQLLRAVKYLNEKKCSYGYATNAWINTSFTSSATNMFPDIDFNVYKYNYVLNEAWYDDEFDSTAGLPGDIPTDTIEKILVEKSDIKIEEWRRWMERFKEQYRAVGHKID